MSAFGCWTRSIFAESAIIYSCLSLAGATTGFVFALSSAYNILAEAKFFSKYLATRSDHLSNV